MILRARAGVKIWSAGHDVDELPEGRRDPLGWYDPLRRLVRTIENHPAPVIAMIEGGVWGGACEVAMACDIIVAAPNATFALTPAKLGVPYNVSGMLTFLNAAPLRLIKEMAFTARPISAERAVNAGLINHIAPSDELKLFTYAIASDIVANAPLSIAVMKEELRILAGAHPMSRKGGSGCRASGASSTTAPTMSRASRRSRRRGNRCTGESSSERSSAWSQGLSRAARAFRRARS